jgi:hypothetical protein
LVGFDTENAVTYQAGGSRRPVSLVQLARDQPPRVLLLRFLGQVNLLPATRRFPSRLLRLLTSDGTTTLGLNIRHDWTLFFSDFPAAGAREVVVARSVDVGKLAIAAGVHPAAGGTRWSLQGLSSRLVARLPFKTKGDADYVDHRRWESESLTPGSPYFLYAVNDAAVLLDLHRKLEAVASSSSSGVLPPASPAAVSPVPAPADPLDSLADGALLRLALDARPPWGETDCVPTTALRGLISSFCRNPTWLGKLPLVSQTFIRDVCACYVRHEWVDARHLLYAHINTGRRQGDVELDGMADGYALGKAVDSSLVVECILGVRVRASVPDEEGGGVAALVAGQDFWPQWALDTEHLCLGQEARSWSDLHERRGPAKSVPRAQKTSETKLDNPYII